MTSGSGREAPDVERIARSMLQFQGPDEAHHGEAQHGDAHHDEHRPGPDAPGGRPHWIKAPQLTGERAAALAEATRRDRERYLRSGLVPVDCRFCHVSVLVKKLGPGHTMVQWDPTSTARCAHFAEIRAAGGNPARERGCPRLADSIRHAIAEGCLEEFSSAPAPGDGEPDNWGPDDREPAVGA
ncbi:hypothetical protein [uncultured Mycolicibacterium sp.]|uniref:hypothetical protein n=1 Tax=uncultured Mycolicibacterium sp. TaxID=2320817 RepID=UPI0026222375|nr:hypothetical protein [uncultured Mycolicibacterium sp.]